MSHVVVTAPFPTPTSYVPGAIGSPVPVVGSPSPSPQPWPSVVITVVAPSATPRAGQSGVVTSFGPSLPVTETGRVSPTPSVAPGKQMPVTGGDVALWATVGLALLLIGGLAYAVSRRLARGHRDHG